jgi:hypothetical protein
LSDLIGEEHSQQRLIDRSRKGIRAALELLVAVVASFLKDLLIIVAVILVSALALYFKVMEDILVVALLALLLSLIIFLAKERRINPMRRMYLDEIAAIERKGGIRDWLKNLPAHSEIKVIGVAGTSIFWLFDLYVQLMSQGSAIEILTLDCRATVLIDLLAENEPELDSRREVDRLLDRLQKMQRCQMSPDSTVVQEVAVLLGKARATSSMSEMRLCVFESCARMWLHAKDKAIQIGNLRSNPLRLKYYNQLPYLKVWTTFPPNLCFSGSYITHPSIGTSNPIVVLNPSRSTHDKIIVNKIINAMKFLSAHPNTRTIDTVNDILKAEE